MCSANHSQIQREEKADKDVNTMTVSQNDGANARPVDADRANKQSRSRSRRRRVTDTGQTSHLGNFETDENTPAAEIDRLRSEQALNDQAKGYATDPAHLAPPTFLSSPPDGNSEIAKGVPLPACPRERSSAGPSTPFPFGTDRRSSNQDVNNSTQTPASGPSVASPNRDEESEYPEDSIASSPPDRNSENAIAVPLPASPGERPSAGPGKAFPFKLGRHLASHVNEDANASTLTLTSQADVISPMEDDSGIQLGHGSSYSQDAHSYTVREDSPHHQRRIEPVEDAHGDNNDGVDYYDLRSKLPLEGEDGNELANQVVSPVEQRRGTMEDAKGVLHHGLGVVGGLGEKRDAKTMRRPEIDRSDTASLD